MFGLSADAAGRAFGLPPLWRYRLTSWVSLRLGRPIKMPGLNGMAQEQQSSAGGVLLGEYNSHYLQDRHLADVGEWRNFTFTAKAQEHTIPRRTCTFTKSSKHLVHARITRARVAATSKTATRPKSNMLGRVCSLGGANTGHGSSFRRKKSSAIEMIRTAAITSACRRRTIRKQVRSSAFLSVEVFDAAVLRTRAETQLHFGAGFLCSPEGLNLGTRGLAHFPRIDLSHVTCDPGGGCCDAGYRRKQVAQSSGGP
jgi:hypothetical protein